METINKSMRIEELLEMLEGGLLIREAYQRTPSHDAKKALEIIDSIKAGRFSGTLTLAEIGDSGSLAILDGSSRLQDLSDYVNNRIFKTESVLEKSVNGDGDTVTVKKKVNRSFQNMEEVEKNAFLNYSFPCVILKNTTTEERVKAFLNVNSSVALSTIQKNKGNAPQVVVDMVEIFVNSNVIKHVFTERLIQKDEPTAWVYTFLSNIIGEYSASNKALVSAVNGADLSEIDVDRFSALLSKFDGVEASMNKYCLMSHVVNLYQSKVDVNTLPIFDNRAIFDIVTAGANSEKQNNSRLDKSAQLLNKLLGYSIKTLKPVKVADAVKEVSLEDIAK